MVLEDQMIRKGPWTEHEDVQLVFYVNLFGDRRWDFIAKVSGLKRTGKSCRLRWVNYLHPGLKRGKMTPHEERLVLELHNKWGNRWSRIARKLPGRTDNEIKNYWRTHMRKKAQEKKRGISPSESSISCSSNSSSSSNCSNDPHIDSMPSTEIDERSFYDTGGLEMMQQVASSKSGKNNSVKSSTSTVNSQDEVSMDEIWKDIDLLEEGGDSIIKPVYDPYSSSLTSPIWDYNPDSLWMMMGTNTDQVKTTTTTATGMFNYPMSEQFGAPLTG